MSPPKSPQPPRPPSRAKKRTGAPTRRQTAGSAVQPTAAGGEKAASRRRAAAPRPHPVAANPTTPASGENAPKRDLGQEVLARHDAESMRTAPPPAGQHARVSSAGYALAVGFICFALWLFLDARQLFNSANAAPLGTRRSVSMSITRPIARIEEALGLDRLVNVGNRALGRSGAYTPGQGTLPPVSIPPSTLPPTSTLPTTTLPGHPSSTIAPTTTTLPVEAPLAEPTVAHPLTVLQIGDSIGEDLGYGLATVIGGVHRIHLVQGSVGDTGLTNIAYFNWPATLGRQIKQFHPRVVVVMMGANDWQSMLVNNTPYQPGAPQWIAAYTARVAYLMSEATAADAKVLWIGLPIMQSSGFSRDMQVLNRIFQTQALLHPGVTYVPTWKLFSTRAGRYSEYLSVAGNLVQVRDADGIHIAPPGGTNLLGSYVMKKMETVWHIRL